MSSEISGSAYLDHIKNKEVQIVEVTAPSGFTFQFKKPSVFGTLFGIGGLPQHASSAVVEKWAEEGLLELGEGEGQLSADKVAALDKGLAIVDRVLFLSYRPKLVSGVAKDPNELSTNDVLPEDLEFLFSWVAKGGDMSAMLETFPDGSEPSALASASRRKVRGKAKSVSGS